MIQDKSTKRPEMNQRMQRLCQRRNRLAIEGRRNLYMDGLLHGIYQWSPGSTSFSPETGVTAIAAEERVCLGDHNCRVGVGKPFPYADQMPSVVGKYEYDPVNWAKDYEFFLAHSPAEINPDERIVGEFHWQLDEGRKLIYPEEIDVYGEKAMALGAGGSCLTHTCPDLSIGMKLGWKGIRAKIVESKERFAGDEKKCHYLDAAIIVVNAIIRHIRAYGEKARELAGQEETDCRSHEYMELSDICERIAEDPPASFREAVQWMQFYQICERMNGHGNGYGRLDQILQTFYEKDIERGVLTPDLARDLVEEFYLKYGGNYFSVSGRNENLDDATNDMSWVCLRAYDMVGGYNCMGVGWHSDIDKDFYRYACEVVARHRCGTPALLNYDIMRKSEIYSGVKEEDAWNVTYSGCQWYCIVGKEYCDQDKNVIVLVQCLQRAFDKAVKNQPESFDAFYDLLLKELKISADALVALKNMEYHYQSKVWPEIVVSCMMHNCIENGLDVTDFGTGNYNFTSVNLLGFTNVVDSLLNIKKMIYEMEKTSFAELSTAVRADFIGYESLRRELLDTAKFGNDDDECDALARRFSDDIENVLRSVKNAKGFHLRPSLFQFMGHSIAGPFLGAGIDGRKKAEPFAQGFNPTHGRSLNGATAVANSMLKIDQQKFIGAPWQCELSPSFFKNLDSEGDALYKLTTTYFSHGGMHINANILAVKDLEEAMKKPEKHQDLMIKVTGYSAHFINLDKHYQSEIVKRTRQNA
ncbi:MAG: hypothetical protein JXR78_04615 [Victivallales bacterium]|nr:hypothetical protein [Victivallales bacterium]